MHMDQIGSGFTHSIAITALPLMSRPHDKATPPSTLFVIHALLFGYPGFLLVYDITTYIFRLHKIMI